MAPLTAPCKSEGVSTEMEGWHHTPMLRTLLLAQVLGKGACYLYYVMF